MMDSDRNIIHTIADMKEMTVAQLKEKYRDVFGEEVRISNKTYLWKKIAYRLQEIKHGQSA